MKKNACGFSMMEMIVSLIVLTSVAVGVLAASSFTTRTKLRLEDKLKATLILEKKIAELRTEDVELLSDGTTTETISELSNGLLTQEIVTPDISVPEYKAVALSLSWTDRRSQTQTQSVFSILYQEG